MTGPDELMSHAADRCSECGQPLAHDQRYCVVCGTRRVPLPARVAVAIGDLADGGRGPDTHAAAVVPVMDTPAPDPVGDLLPLARAAAVSILLMLGFGSVLGAATTPGGVTSLASTIVVALSPASHPAPTTIAAVTTPAAPRTRGGSGVGGGGGGTTAPTPTTQTARTVTVSASSTSPTPTSSATTSTPTTSPTTQLPPIHHVWEIVLSDQGYAQSFGDAHDDPYLARTLVDQGTLISDYDAVAGSPLANEVALVSGQGPTEQTLADCPQYDDITPGRTGRHGQIVGQGCLYPASAQTLGSELQIQGLQWRAYVQGIDQPAQTSPPTTSTTTTTASATTSTTATTPAAASASATTPTPTPTTSTTTPGSTSTTASGSQATVADTSTADACPHPAEGAADPAGPVRGRDDYVTWKNPFVYFHSVLDTTTCAQEDVGLGALAGDLRKESTTPAFSYIAPDPCDDGSSTPCRPKAKDGMRQADRFLKTVVPEIERSAAYKDDGLILITFDEAPQSGPDGSTASCCGEPTFPNLPKTSTTATTSTTGTSPTTATTPTTSVTTTASTLTSPLTTSTTTTPTTTTCPTLTTTATTPTTPTTPATTPTTPATTTTSTTTSPSDCAPAITGDPPGGGQVGMLMISPYVTADKVNVIDEYNHFSTLKSVADLLGVTPPGYAASSDITAFNSALFLTNKR
jgi:hypothetical protein